MRFVASGEAGGVLTGEKGFTGEGVRGVLRRNFKTRLDGGR